MKDLTAILIPSDDYVEVYEPFAHACRALGLHPEAELVRLITLAMEDWEDADALERHDGDCAIWDDVRNPCTCAGRQTPPACQGEHP